MQPQSSFLADLADLDPDAGPPEIISAAEDPELANMIAEQALKSDQPEMREAPSGQVELPGGWISPDGELHTTAIVDELTGLAEERLARIDPVANLPLFLHTMVDCALQSIGTHKPSPEMLKSLLVGDRDALILGIRIATYGEHLEMHITCPECRAEEDLAIELLKDIPVTKMETPVIREYDVELRDGRVAVVTPLTCGVQDDVWDIKKSAAEIKTSMLERCVLTIDGQRMSHGQAQRLGLGDRKALLDRLEEIQPGPDYGGVRLPCQACGEEFTLRLDLTDLFR